MEVVPYVQKVEDDAEILFVPSTRLATEIVSRTAVTVSYRPSDELPVASIQTTSLDEIGEAIKLAKRSGDPDSRTWTPEEVEEKFREQGVAEILEFLEFAKQYSADGQYTAAGRKKSPGFGFYVAGTRENGTATKLMIVGCNLTWGGAYVYLNFAQSITNEATVNELRRRLVETFGVAFNSGAKEASIPYSALCGNMEDFRQTLLWFKAESARIAETR